MKKDLVEAVMNPVRMRILQYVAEHGSGTVGEIAKAMPDVPKPSLYRHIKILVDAEMIGVIAEKSVRGTVERTYGLAQHDQEEVSTEEMGLLVQNSLLSLVSSFGRYFQLPDSDPIRDMLCVSASTLMLNDDDYKELLLKIGCLCQEAAKVPLKEDAKSRCLALVSAPSMERKDEK